MSFGRRAQLCRAQLPLALLTAAALVLALPTAASAQFRPVFDDFREDGRVDACSFSPGQLGGALDGVPPDIEAYAPNFIDEVNRALNRRGAGACAPAPPPGPEEEEEEEEVAASPDSRRVAAGPTPEPPVLTRTASDDVLTAGADAPAIASRLSGDRSLPAAVIVLGTLLSALLLGTLAWALTRSRLGRGGPRFRDE